MDIKQTKATKLAYSNLRSILMESIYLKYGKDYTRPTQIYGVLTNRCNLKCKMCYYWRKEPTEIPASYWIKALISLRKFTGFYHINLSGGEPLIKKDIFDILQACQENDISVGITTNGFLLNKNRVDKLIDNNIFNINISIDSMDENIHDKMRGIPGMHSRIMTNIDYLMEKKTKADHNTRVILKTIVCKDNLDGLDKVVEYAKHLGLTGVEFQPIMEWTEDSVEMMDINPVFLEDKIGRLIQMKQDGDPILNSVDVFKEGVQVYKENYELTHSEIQSKVEREEVCDSSTNKNNQRQCSVPLRNIFIDSNGDVALCPDVPSKIGNIKDCEIGEMWTSERTKKLRATLVNCRRKCYAACTVKRNLRDYYELFKRFSNI
ncbi:MAG: radical SAM protein [candidate division Zixibacteria bacterium]|nr:radical SAM protein [candidate division Zixibacteria bacterium]